MPRAPDDGRHRDILARQAHAARPLLDHSLRQQIVELVEKNPGMGKGELRRALGCSWGTVHHHAGLLTGEGLIHLARSGRHVRYFLPGMGSSEIERMVALKQGRAMEFARGVMQTPGITQTVIVQENELSRKVLRPYVEQLSQQGLIEEVRENSSCRYLPTQRLATILDLIEVNGKDDVSPENGDLRG